MELTAQDLLYHHAEAGADSKIHQALIGLDATAARLDLFIARSAPVLAAKRLRLFERQIPEALDLMDHAVEIPMVGTGHSLNVQGAYLHVVPRDQVPMLGITSEQALTRVAAELDRIDHRGDATGPLRARL